MTRRMDRRALFTSGAAAALLAATGLSAQAAPRRGGRLRIAVPRENGSLDLIMRAAVFDALTEVGADGVLRGELATDWRSIENASAWEFDLRSDVLFHDGRPMSADDVVTSIAANWPEVKITAVSEWTLRFQTAEPNPNLPMMLADPAFIVRPADDDSGLVGTGLYRAASWQEGRAFLGKRCDAHYKDGRAGWFDAVEVAVIPDPAVRAQALKEGFVDVAELPDPQSLSVRDDLFLFPDADRLELAAREGLARPRFVGARLPLDDGRISERWWML